MKKVKTRTDRARAEKSVCKRGDKRLTACSVRPPTTSIFYQCLHVQTFLQRVHDHGIKLYDSCKTSSAKSHVLQNIHEAKLVAFDEG